VPNPLTAYLRRFRRVVAPPGRPAPGAVPADRVADVRAEVVDLLTAIDRIGEEATEIVRRTEAEVEDLRIQTRTRVERLSADARHQASEARQTAAALRQERVTEELEALLDEARGRAAEIEHKARERLPLFTDRVLAVLLPPTDTTQGETR
jgi:hypothetical protein